jgi:hypothetical protein
VRLMATESGIYRSIGGDLSRLACTPRRFDYIRILMWVSTKTEPHYPAENAKDLLQENSLFAVKTSKCGCTELICLNLKLLGLS